MSHNLDCWSTRPRRGSRTVTAGGEHPEPRRAPVLMLIIAYRILFHVSAMGRRRFPRAGAREVAVRDVSDGTRRIRQGLAALALAVLAIAGIDWIAAAARGPVNSFNGHWWGAAQKTPWSTAGTHSIKVLSRELAITIAGDELTAVYTLTAPAGSPIADVTESDSDSNAGNDIVDNLLGDVQVGEFRYGFTGQELVSYQLTFKPPILQIAPDNSKHLTAKLVVTSYPFRLYLHRQQIMILPPSTSAIVGSSNMTVVAPSVQVDSTLGAEVGSVANGVANLRINEKASTGVGSVSFLVSEGSASSSWLSGLRTVGRTVVPVADWFLYRMANLFIYAVFYWALFRARRKFFDNPYVIIGFQAVQTVVIALVAVAVLGLASDLSWKLAASGPGRDFLQAGPLGLLCGGAVFVWPFACWQAGAVRSGDQVAEAPLSEPAVTRRRRWQAAGPVLLVIVTVFYWVRLSRLGIDPFAGFSIIAGTMVLVLSLPLLVRLLLGNTGALFWIASAGLLATAFAAATSWPLLIYRYYYNLEGTPLVNLWGKWAYVMAALVVVAGLCILSGRIAWRAFKNSRRGSQIGSLVAAAAVAGITVAAVVPDSFSEAEVAGSHVDGLAPSDLFALFDALPELTDWVILLLAILVVMRLPRWPDPRLVARDLALPIALMIFYWSDRWLYLPITAIIGIFLIRRFMMPRELACVPPSDVCPEMEVRNAVAGWRQAEFITGQEQALAVGGADALRDTAVNGKAKEFQRRLARLAEAREQLAAERSKYQDVAQSAMVDAFSRRGASADPRSAAFGTIAGVVLGIIPAVITMLTNQPAAGSNSYPALGFFGVTAWNLFSWTALGWFIGYFLPLIRGASGAGKGMWIFIVGAAAGLPASLIWDDTHDWAGTLVGDLEFLVFVILLSVIVCDLRPLWRAGLRPTDWARVHNWRFVASWSAALIAAVGTIAITFATTTVTDLSQQLTHQPPSSSSHP